MDFWKIIELYVGRTVDFSTEVILQDNGDGSSFIAYWGIDEKPQPTQESLNELNDDVVDYELNKAKEDKIQELRVACYNDIIEGFYSNVYGGESRLYSFSCDKDNPQDDDQNNMLAMLIFASIPFIGEEVPFYWKAKGEKISYEWTSNQILQLCKDAYLAKIVKMRFFHELRYIVTMATSIGEVEAVTWGM